MPLHTVFTWFMFGMICLTALPAMLKL